MNQNKIKFRLLIFLLINLTFSAYAEDQKLKEPHRDLEDPDQTDIADQYSADEFENNVKGKDITPLGSKTFVKVENEEHIWAIQWQENSFQKGYVETGSNDKKILLRWAPNIGGESAVKFPMRAAGKLSKGRGSGNGLVAIKEPTWKVALSNITLDLDVDSDNNNRYKTPNFSDAEDKIEEKSPGKVIMVNVDDDDKDGKPDNFDTKIEDDKKDGYKDLPPMRLKFEPGIEKLGKDLELYIKLSNYKRLRVFNSNGDHLIGIEKVEPLKLEKKYFSNGILDMKLEGVKVGEVTVSVVSKDGKVLDKVLVNIADSLETKPFNFKNIMQRRDSDIYCKPCLT